MPDLRRITVTESGDVTLVRFVDRKIVDEAQVNELAGELGRLVDVEKRRALLLNFSGVEFVSSAGLGKLIALERKLKLAKGRLKMSDMVPEVMSVFEITKLNKVFDIRASEAEALKAF